ncbi:hypothetical protein C5167_013950 [Papaver somniferum]|uniref:Uncharacterized protein n=1 Tax=Papaver somniferum TaxID=3469 RepID=A0A4Y7J570_PAPSO|nr:hypothetical protein C5167_013950 [Papaver somniferum]
MLGFLDSASLPTGVMTAVTNGASSSQKQLSSTEQDYWNNWNTMEKYFSEDRSMPASKRLRLNGTELSIATDEASDIIVIEPSATNMNQPHKWFNGQTSNATVKGKDKATISNT